MMMNLAQLPHDMMLADVTKPHESRRSSADDGNSAHGSANGNPGQALFLAGLSESCEFTDLHQYFEPFGRVVLCRVLKDAKTGRSRRVGYVNFAVADDAVKAMQALHGKPGPGGAPFDIKIAAQDPTFKPQETRKVFVRYVPLHVTSEQMRAAFGQFGEIEDCVVSRDLSRTARREPGPWNMAYVTYKSTRDAVRAVAEAASIIRFGDQDLTVKPAVSEETLRLRSKTRQQAAKQQQQQQAALGHGAFPPQQQVQQQAAPAMAAAPPGAIVAPPGMVPVMIPGIGIAFMPMQQLQQQQPQQQQVSTFQPQQFQQFQQFQQPQQEYQQQQPPVDAPQGTPNTPQPAAADAFGWPVKDQETKHASVFGGSADAIASVFGTGKQSPVDHVPASRRESGASQSLFIAPTGTSTPTYDAADFTPAPQWM